MAQQLARSGIVRVKNDQHASEARRDLFEQPHPLAADRALEVGETRHVAAGTCHAGDKAAFDRTGNLHEYDRGGLDPLVQRRHRLRPDGQNRVGRSRRQFSRTRPHAIGIT
jgi:hypothetical protein